ncbi:hypothetical protein MTR_7g053400 [Medicago truncatula]|uniref:RNase H type-1 domain-containing protein n=1 Tax=Medicago truncatula TaxID=3880 RepID=A0A072TYG7_MEDTR|nr:hypothetical protein MTR_7g053400 [Medicago truncatula]
MSKSSQRTTSLNNQNSRYGVPPLNFEANTKGWRIMTNPLTLIARMYKFILKAGSKWKIGDGSSIPIWNNNWIVGNGYLTLQNHGSTPFDNLKVSDCIILEAKVWNVLNGDDAALLCCILWSIWKQQNNKVWNDITEAHVDVLKRAKVLLQDWRAAKSYQQQPLSVQNIVDTSKWKKPVVGMCIRDDTSALVLAKTEWFSPLCEVHIGEALGLLSALEWVHELNLGPMDFEMDAKKVGFVQRQTNEATHALAKTTT